MHIDDVHSTCDELFALIGGMREALVFGHARGALASKLALARRIAADLSTVLRTGSPVLTSATANDIRTMCAELAVLERELGTQWGAAGPS